MQFSPGLREPVLNIRGEERVLNLNCRDGMTCTCPTKEVFVQHVVAVGSGVPFPRLSEKYESCIHLAPRGLGRQRSRPQKHVHPFETLDRCDDPRMRVGE